MIEPLDDKVSPRFCSKCLAMSTRPRITFDEFGVCSACQWASEKKILDWDFRQQQLLDLLELHRGKGQFDCLVPVSGGKDGSYVAYNLKHKYGMNPLCLTITPPLALPLGEENLRAFRESGYDHISVSPNPEAMRVINTVGFERMGFPYYGWLTAIHTAVLRIAQKFEIDLIFYGEDGEVEYGGGSETKHDPIYGVEYQKKVYLEGGITGVLAHSGLSPRDKYWFEYPDMATANISLTHWSYFEDWDPYRNYLIAKEFTGLKENLDTNEGTFTNFAQNDQALYSLHAYLMYLKFGFGRANQDACIEVRRGAMDRHQAVNLVRIYDGEFPENHLESYLEYFQMSEERFNSVLDGFANTSLLTRQSPGRWVRNFEVS